MRFENFRLMSASGSMFAEVVNGSYVLLVGNLLHHFESTDISNTVANSLICNTTISLLCQHGFPHMSHLAV
jgi:hypothetical protein